MGRSEGLAKHIETYRCHRNKKLGQIYFLLVPMNLETMNMVSYKKKKATPSTNGG